MINKQGFFSIFLFVKPYFFFFCSILEINCIQTGVSAGASLSSGIIYTLPALTLLNSSGQASKLEYQDTLLIALVGGILGIMFSIPLRRALIIEEQLTYPEGVATAQVLKGELF